ncbi:MAG: sigma 54-interacting transcriptional regulator [Candidatus Zixiibacteriota bacterium]
MSTSRTTKLKSIDKLLSSKSYEEVILKINQLDISELSEEEIAYKDLLLIRANLAIGNYDIAHLLSKTIKYYKFTNMHDKFARIKFYNGLYLIYIGNLVDAKESLTESYICYKRIDDKTGQAVVLSRLAEVQYIVGDVPSTIRLLEKSLNLLDNNDIKRIRGIKSNIAQFYIISGRINNAECLLREIAKSWSRSNNQFYINYLMRLSTIYSLKGEYQESRRYLSKSLPYLLDNTYERVVYHENLGWTLNLEKDYDQAIIELQKGLRIASENSPSSTLVSQIKRRMADSYLGLKDYPNSAKYADEALAVAEKLNERVEIAECWRIQAQIANYHGEVDKARGLFKQAIDMFKMIGTQYNLASCRYIAATSGLYHNGERQALLFLAREYFASEDVQHYIKKIDDEFKKNLQSSKPVKPPQNAPVVIATSSEMKKVVETAQVMSQADMTILLTGDTGTGKDLLARYIHDCSGCKGEFISVNIAGIPESMIEGELFGHRKGAFTGASHARAGLLEMAHNGTFYLNEVNSTPPAIQAKLLDVLERRKVRRLGENIWRDVSFRLISATNHDLEELIRKNEFRADFYHRIKQVEIALSSLIERPEDIPALIQYFLSQVGLECDESQAQTIASRFESHLWPGNVRELKAEIEKLAVLSGRNINRLFASLPTDDGYQKEQLLTLLEKYNWNRTRVAKELGLTEGTIRHRIRKFKLL